MEERSEQGMLAGPRCHRDAGMGVALGGDGAELERGVGGGREKAEEWGGGCSEHLRAREAAGNWAEEVMGSLGMGSCQCGKRRAAQKGPPHPFRYPSSGAGHQTHPADADTPTGGAKTLNPNPVSPAVSLGRSPCKSLPRCRWSLGGWG